MIRASTMTDEDGRNRSDLVNEENSECLQRVFLSRGEGESGCQLSRETEN